MKRRGFMAIVSVLGIAAMAGCATGGGAAASGAGGPDKVVYHLNEGFAQASNGLRNIGNHLEVNPGARIVVVSHARGVDFLMKDAKDANGAKYEDLVEQLVRRGVQFDVCEITLTPSMQGGKAAWNCKGYPLNAMPPACGGKG